jgi:hypothetical protein
MRRRTKSRNSIILIVIYDIQNPSKRLRGTMTDLQIISVTYPDTTSSISRFMNYYLKLRKSKLYLQNLQHNIKKQFIF